MQFSGFVDSVYCTVVILSFDFYRLIFALSTTFRINKKGSQKDAEQKRSGNYFFYDDGDDDDVDDDDI